MKDPNVIYAAMNLRTQIDCSRGDTNIYLATQALAQAMNGYKDMLGMSPGESALYLLSLMLSQPEDV